MDRPELATERTEEHDLRDLVLYRMSLFSTVTDRAGQMFLQRRFGVSLREYRLIGIVGYAQPASVTDIAEEAFMDKSQVSKTAQKLIDEGLLCRVDRRGRIIESRGKLVLTRKGERLYKDAYAYAWELNREAMSSLSPEEHAQFSGYLDRILAHAYDRHDQVSSNPALHYLGDFGPSADEWSDR